jgi:hypothetical protein
MVGRTPLGRDQYETDDQKPRPENRQMAIIGEQGDQQQAAAGRNQQAVYQQ